LAVGHQRTNAGLTGLTRARSFGSLRAFASGKLLSRFPKPLKSVAPQRSRSSACHSIRTNSWNSCPAFAPVDILSFAVRRAFDPTPLFTQREWLPWFWFFVTVACCCWRRFAMKTNQDAGDEIISAVQPNVVPPRPSKVVNYSKLEWCLLMQFPLFHGKRTQNDDWG
jgi:hypothetical protein